MFGRLIDGMIAQNDEFNRHWKTPLGTFLRHRNRYSHKLYLTTFTLRLTLFIFLQIAKILGRINMLILSCFQLSFIIAAVLGFAGIALLDDGNPPVKAYMCLGVAAIMLAGSTTIAMMKINQDHW